MPHALLARFRAARVIPVVRTRSAQTAAMAVGWLRDAGIRIFEITMTVPDGVAPIPRASFISTPKGAGARPLSAFPEPCRSMARSPPVARAATQDRADCCGPARALS